MCGEAPGRPGRGGLEASRALLLEGACGLPASHRAGSGSSSLTLRREMCTSPREPRPWRDPGAPSSPAPALNTPHLIHLPLQPCGLSATLSQSWAGLFSCCSNCVKRPGCLKLRTKAATLLVQWACAGDGELPVGEEGTQETRHAGAEAGAQRVGDWPEMVLGQGLGLLVTSRLTPDTLPLPGVKPRSPPASDSPPDPPSPFQPSTQNRHRVFCLCTGTGPYSDCLNASRGICYLKVSYD